MTKSILLKAVTSMDIFFLSKIVVNSSVDILPLSKNIFRYEILNVTPYRYMCHKIHKMRIRIIFLLAKQI